MVFVHLCFLTVYLELDLVHETCATKAFACHCLNLHSFRFMASTFKDGEANFIPFFELCVTLYRAVNSIAILTRIDQIHTRGTEFFELNTDFWISSFCSGIPLPR